MLARVIAGLDPAIHLLRLRFFSMDARVKPAHDDDLYLNNPSPTNPSAPTMMRHQANSAKPWLDT